MAWTSALDVQGMLANDNSNFKILKELLLCVHLYRECPREVFVIIMSYQDTHTVTYTETQRIICRPLFKKCGGFVVGRRTSPLKPAKTALTRRRYVTALRLSLSGIRNKKKQRTEAA